MFNIRRISLLLIAILIFAIIAFKDLNKSDAYSRCSEDILKSNDFYTLSALGIQSAIYDPNTGEYYDVTDSKSDLFKCKNQLEIPGAFYPDANIESVLLLRTSELELNETLSVVESHPYNTIIVICDNVWNSINFDCSNNNFISNNSSENVLIDVERNLNAGYIRNGDKTIFALPEIQLNNILQYPSLLNLVSGISSSQHIDIIRVSNNIEIGKQHGVSFFTGLILFVLLLNLIIIFLLRIINLYPPVNKLAPFISIFIPISIFVYSVKYLPFVMDDMIQTLNKILGLNVNLLPSIFWILASILLSVLVFYTGYEFNLIFSKYKNKSIKYLSGLNANIIKLLIIACLSYALILLSKDTQYIIPSNFTSTLVLAFLLTILLNFVGVGAKLTLPALINNLPSKFGNLNVISLIGKVGFIAILVFLASLANNYVNGKPESKNKFLFEPARDYFTAPYNKTIRPDEVFHEYNLLINDSLFINDYIISHPQYSEITYGYISRINKNPAFGYKQSSEENTIRSLINSDMFRLLDTQEKTSYFRILNKSDLESPLTFKLNLECTSEKNTNINIEKFRLAYDKKTVVHSISPIYTKRKCTLGESFEIIAILKLRDITTYAYSDEILKLSSNNNILSVDITAENPAHIISYLDLKKEGDYIFHHQDNAEVLHIITDDPKADTMSFKTNETLDLSNGINLLRKRKLINSAITIDSLNKYTLIKYIK